MKGMKTLGPSRVGLLVPILTQQIHIQKLRTPTRKLRIYIHFTCFGVPDGLVIIYGDNIWPDVMSIE